MKRIAIFGTSANPPHNSHLEIVKALKALFDEVIVVPCGPRPDKQTTNDIAPVHRAAMVQMTFQDIPEVTVDLFDLENGTYTITHDLDARYRHLGEIWHLVGADLIVGGRDGKSPIQTSWTRGKEIWNKLNFVVCHREGYEINEADLPPHHRVITVQNGISSTQVRERAFRHEPLLDLVTPKVAAYIERYGLYRGTPTGYSTRLNLDNPRLFLVPGDRNERAQTIAGRLARLAGDHFTVVSDVQEADLIVPIGGDGTMLHTIRHYWQKRIPFFGLNAGTVGYLLNGIGSKFGSEIFRVELFLYHSPLLYAEVVTAGGEVKTGLAFNDCWVQGLPGQTAWIKIKVNGSVYKHRVAGDGVLLATPAGSTAYAFAMGATPQLVGSPLLTMAGSNISRPLGWHHAPLPIESAVEFMTADPTQPPKKRPLLGFVDGVAQGEIISMKLRISRIAAAEVAFMPAYRPERKLSKLLSGTGW